MSMPFPPILVINLSDRRDRWAQIQSDFKSWPVKLERCTASHRKCLMIAKEKRWPWVLCIEDDANPTEGSYKRFCELLPLLWKSRGQWDIFNGGFSTTHEASVQHMTPPIFKATGWGTQFCLVHAGAYDMLIQDIGEDPPEAPDNFYSRKKYKMWCTAPHLSVQREGKSDLEDRVVNRDDATEKANQKLFNVLNLHRMGLGFIAISLLTLFALGKKRR
jgi:hypothetical protein